MRTEARNGDGKVGEAGGQERGAEQAVHRATVGVLGEAPGFWAISMLRKEPWRSWHRAEEENTSLT